MPDPSHSATFGTLLRELRLAAGLTQEALAEQAGLSPRSIQQLEAAGARPRRSTAQQLARALALSAEQRARFEAAASPAPRRRGGTGVGAPPRPGSDSGQPLRCPNCAAARS